MTADLINAGFELGGFIMMLPSLVRAWRLRAIVGVHWATPAFFWSWGLWNVFYYPHLDQWLSFTAGLLLIVSNSAWFAMVILFTRKEPRA